MSQTTYHLCQDRVLRGKIITKIFTNKDITKTGSGNIGATNVYRSVSKKAGILVLFLDGIKPMLALLVIQFFNAIII